ncbi:MAG: NAD-dependent deacylase [Rhodocyclaceae bacterium]|jgi:NAD-dependent deacetylase|nr:NAD-dependent deacylase [Rhodocyclaceae bacterium]
MDQAATLDAVARLIHGARRLLFVTGAGVSADSGLPTYRGMGGLYEDAPTDEGIPIEEALSGVVFQRRPEITWKYLAQIERTCRGARPNPAHQAIAEFQRSHPGSLVLTQNVDGLHRAAGSTDLIEIHGALHRLICTECGRQRQVADFNGLQIPPACPACGGLLRPDVVLFGEELPAAGLLRLEHALAAGFDLVFTIGTRAAFPYVAAPVHWARRAGVPTVEINPDASEVSDLVDYRIALGAAQALGELLARLGSKTI